ncbi:MAG: TIM barrel protein [Spirochaetales bacterium]|nr:TIM barrel protein [Spirochaetales bacterium]
MTITKKTSTKGTTIPIKESTYEIRCTRFLRGQFAGWLDHGAQAESAVKKCVGALRLADAIGAKCCVNISGNAGPGAWDGPSPANLTKETFQRVVEITRRIIDEAAPERASYCLETMPWMYPNSILSYLELIESINRPRFGVHFDPVNLINSPEKHYGNGNYIRDAVSRLALRILSVHAKDQVMGPPLTLTMHEVIPGEGISTMIHCCGNSASWTPTHRCLLSI